MAVVFFGLVTTVFVSALLGSLAFLEVAFQGTVPQPNRKRQWQPPFAQGKELLAWARRIASRCTDDLLGRNPHPQSAQAVVVGMRDGIESALATICQGPVTMQTSTSLCRQSPVLTPPEAIEIAAHLRRTKSRREIQEIAQRATMNHEQRSASSTPPPCPLWSGSGQCLIGGSEPLQCRAGCLGCSQNLEQAKTLVEGVTLGISAAVEAARLDGSVCELNGALALALRTPDIATRWASGERLFEECRVPAAKS